MLINLQKIIANEGESVPIKGSIAPFSAIDGEVNDISVCGFVHNFSGRLELHLSITGVYHALCSRCSTDVVAPIEVTLDDRLVREPSDEEYILLENDNFNVTSYVHQEISLNLPIRILCKDDCHGLCVSCGANLNKKQCDCVSDVIDPRFENLKKLLDKKEE